VKEMKFNSSEITFEIPEEWLNEARFSSEPNGRSHYEYEYSKNVFLVSVVDIFPKIRGQDVPIFNDGESDGELKTARERTVSILKAIQLGVPLPPVKVVNLNGDKKYKFKLVEGCHRFHCSIVAGFEKIPAVYGFDINVL
jgi:hypothetical protein